jgi:hypothetical protein
MRALDWQNYVVAQLSQAALGLIPRHAVAMGVEPHSDEIVIHFQLTEVDARDTEDMDDIVGELGDLLGDVVDIRTVHTLRSHPLLSPHDGVRWVYRGRTEGDIPTLGT